MRPRLLLIALLFGLLPLSARAEPPHVVASIKPLHSLIAGLMAGTGNSPALIVPGAASPHEYALRPSDARNLSHADLIFWIGPTMESFLVKPLSSLAGKAEVIEIDRAPDVTTLPAREGGAWEPDADAPPPPPGVEHRDGHLWLDPANARAIVRIAAEKLTQRDPGNAERYRKNAADLESRLSALDGELRDQFFPIAGKPFIVFHDAYQYLEKRYALDAVGAISVDPDRQVGARRIAEIRAKVRDSGARCIFGEPQFSPALMATLTQGTGLKTGTLDDLGTDTAPGPVLYFAVLRGVAKSLTDCLAR